MGFFSNIIKKVGGFISSLFRDVEKPIDYVFKEAEEIVNKAFREFQEFIEPEIKKEYRRKIIKPSGIGSKNFIYKSGRIIPWYALTYEDNDTDRRNFLEDKLLGSVPIGTSLDKQIPEFGYDQEDEPTTKPPFIYPDFEVDTE